MRRKDKDERRRAFHERFETNMALEDHFVKELDQVFARVRELRKLKRALSKPQFLVSPQTIDAVLREAFDHFVEHHLTEARTAPRPKGFKDLS
jgi:hypothetical protein